MEKLSRSPCFASVLRVGVLVLAAAMLSFAGLAVAQDSPDPPGGLSVSEDTPGEVVVSWTAPSGSGATTYRVARLSASDGTVTLASGQSGTTYTDSSVLPDTEYRYYVWATRNSVESGSVSRGIRTGGGPGAPDPPSGLSVSEDTPGQVVVSWTAPSGSGATKYRVARLSASDGTVTLASGQSGTTYTDSSVLPDTEYRYYVWATRNSVESGSASRGIRTGGGPGAPDPPGDLVASEDTAGEVVVSWSAPSGDGETTYRIERLSASPGTVSLASGHSATTYTDTSVLPDTEYRYSVWAKRNSVESGSASVGIRTGGGPGAQVGGL